ncbi:MAG: hypothetical protein AAFU77_14410 [Myxococcota bacterium]
MVASASSVVDISPRLVAHCTVERYFSRLRVLKEPVLEQPSRPVSPPATGTRWQYVTVNGFFSGAETSAEVQDVVIVRTGRKCSTTLGRLDGVFRDFGGES